MFGAGKNEDTIFGIKLVTVWGEEDIKPNCTIMG